MAVVDENRNIVFAAELAHRGNIKKKLEDRKGIRRSRRSRKLRYRKPRWRNRKGAVPILKNGKWIMRRVKTDEGIKGYGDGKGWVPPSLMSRVYNIHTWVARLCKCFPITEIALEHVKFDTQLMENPNISGVEYQQGTLAGYEVKEYLLEKYKWTCAYCGKKNTPLQTEHIFPKGKGGTDRISNLAIACSTCNQAKGNQRPDEITDKSLKRRVKEVLNTAKKPLANTAMINSIRWKIAETLEVTSLPVVYGTGGQDQVSSHRITTSQKNTTLMLPVSPQPLAHPKTCPFYRLKP